MTNKKVLITAVVLIILTTACGNAPAAEPSAMPVTASPVPPTPTGTPPASPTHTPTGTPTATPTNTLTPTQIPSSTPTPLPGLVVLPIDVFSSGIPWLPLDSNAMPGVNYLAFNTHKPPFNNAQVRAAFAHAIDRQVLVEMAAGYKVIDPRPATSFTPPETLGRDLYNQVGAVFDPQKARDQLLEAGYTDPSTFPTATLLVNAYGDVAPGARFNMANAMVEMWRENLGVTVEVKVVANFKDYGSRLRTDPPEIFWQGWVADANDPDNFLRAIFHSGSEYNFGGFSDPTFDQLVGKASRLSDPAKRLELYLQAEQVLCSDQVALIPLYYFTFK